MNYKFSQFKTGQKVTCGIEGDYCEGKIYINWDNEDYDRGVFICQNVHSGTDSPETFGYDCSWCLCNIDENFEEGMNEVDDLIILGIEKPKTAPELLKEKITLGTDPEFCIIGKEGQIIGANEIFKPKTDPLQAELGYDGHSQTAEMRIKPAKTPAEATKYIKQILQRSKKLYPQVFQNNMIAQHSNISLGGHLHFGHTMLKDSYSGSYEIINKLVLNLDTLLAFPALYLENTELAKERRNRFGYGKMSDHRGQPWGIEYRALSSFIASKELTEDIFYLGHAIADATLFHNYEVKPLVEDSEVFQIACNKVAKTLLKPQLPKVYKAQRKLPLYLSDKKYQDAIEDFIAQVKKGTPMFSEEMKKGWNIKFNMADFLKVDRIETLLEKVADTLVAIHTAKKKFTNSNYTFVTGSETDTACAEIAETVNLALNHLIKENVLAQKNHHVIRVVGLSEKRGNTIWFGKLGLHGKRTKQLLASAWQIAGLFDHSTKIENVKFTKELKPMTIGFGQAIRKENMLVAEAVAVIASLLVNRELYKQEEKIRGKNTKLYITEQKLTKPLLIHFEAVKEIKVKPAVNILPNLNNVKLPYILKPSLNYNEIYNIISRLSGDKKMEIRKALQPIRKEIVKTMLKNDDLNQAGRENAKAMPIKTLKTPSLCYLLAKLFQILPSIEDNLTNPIYSCNYIYSCSSCSSYTSGLSFCGHCGTCSKCCHCPQKPSNILRLAEIKKLLEKPVKKIKKPVDSFYSMSHATMRRATSSIMDIPSMTTLTNDGNGGPF